MAHPPLTRLITKPDIVKHAFQDSNFNLSLIKDYVIEIAQERHIKPVLTKDLYDEIVAQVQTSSVTVLNQAVLDLVEPALAFFVKAEALIDIMSQVVSKGIQLNNTEFSAPATDKQRADLKSNTFVHANTLLDKVTEFLNDEDNIDDYPLYDQDDINVANEIAKIGDIGI